MPALLYLSRTVLQRYTLANIIPITITITNLTKTIVFLKE